MPNTDQVLRSALELPEDERARVAIAILDGPPDHDAEHAWAEEVAGRLQDLDAGDVRTVPIAETLARARSRLRPDS